MPFVLGHARSMKAIHGGKAKHARIDAQKMAMLLRGGMLPQADVDPAARRATRALRRRRRHLTRKRAERLAHLQNTNSQYHLPAIGKKLASTANRDGVADRFAEPAVQKSIAVDLALLGHDDRLRTDFELDLVQTAKAHEAQPFYRWRASPGVGTILALVLRDEIHAIRRCPRVQAFVADCRLGQCAKASAGKRAGTSGTKMGKADLTWAFSKAAVLCLRNNPAGQKSRARIARQQGKGQALTILAQK